MDPDDTRKVSRLDASVLAYDDALRQGQVSWQSALGSSELDADEVAEFQTLQGCLRKLERVWSRGRFSSTNLSWHTEAAGLAAALQRMAGEETLPKAPITSVEGLKRAVIESGLTTAEDLDTWLSQTPSDQSPRTVAELAYEMVERNILSAQQALVLCKGDLGKLALGDYLIVEELGRGGLGVVYRALDRRRNLRVALKALYHTDQVATAQLKREFRALSNLTHPNLVVRDELRFVEDHWFFTMELVDGEHFTQYVRNETPIGKVHLRQTAADAVGPLGSGRQLARLRHGLRQLATGLDALHQAGKLHRDVKPSNVLVTPEGQVVLVDFGMVVDVELERADRPEGNRPAGTLSYMSPEQSEGKPLTEASDWYSVGVMLYQTLTGELPFLGRFDAMLKAKRRGPPPLPSDLKHAQFSDLAELCQQLLQSDPTNRPRGEEVLQRLGCKPSAGITAAGKPPTKTDNFFVGREAELGHLHQALADVLAGRPVSIYVHGPSGIGKTALVAHFLEQVESRQDVLTLRGRCYERESVPYKALDGIVDALVLHLRTMPTSQLQGLLPDEVACLTRVFPALNQLRPVRDRSASETIPAEQQEVRRLAVHALRQLLSRLGRLQPTVLFVDDLQWGDADSAVLLNELLDSPSLLFVGCYRSEDRLGSPCLQTLLETASESAADTDRRQVTIQPLNQEESRLLAATLLDANAGSPDSRAAALSRESHGNPYFLVELARRLPGEVSRTGEAAQPLPVDLEEMLLGRVGLLPQVARELLNVIAVAGHPLHMEEACRAIGSTPDPRMTALLQSEQLIRTTGGGHPDEVETYHDRIRETVSANLSAADTRGCHARLATALEASPEADPETLCVHFEAAGENEKAGRYGALAADRAADALAFDRAARLYRFVLGLGEFDPSDEPDLHRKLADALANAGRGSEAAEHYLIATDQVVGVETVELKRLAADQLLRCGHYQEGRRVLAETLSAVGLKMPKSLRHGIFIVLVDSLRLWLRGKRFREREEARIPREELVRVDICGSAGFTLCMMDGFIGCAFFPRYGLLARRVGEPGRIAMAMAMDANARTVLMSCHTAGSVSLMKTAEALATRHENPYWIGVVKQMKGEAEGFLGHWRRGIRIRDEAEAILRQNCTGVYFETSRMNLDAINSLFFLGDIKELSRRIPQILREADQRDDLFAGFAPRTFFGNTVWLAADQVEEARRQAERALAGWPREPFLMQHTLELIGSTSIDLYEGDGCSAWDRIAEAWPHLKRRAELRHPFLGGVAVHLRARAALASLGQGLNDPVLIRSAERDAKKIFHARTSWPRPLARLVRAGVAAARGKKEQALEELETAVGEFDRWEMALYSAAAKKRLGELLGGRRGEEMITAGDEFMTDQGIVCPDRMTRMLAPGFGGNAR